MITNVVHNEIGSLSFELDGELFDAYPKRRGLRVLVQSAHRIGWVLLDSGQVLLCPHRSDGAFEPDLSDVAPHCVLTNAERAVFLKGVSPR